MKWLLYKMATLKVPIEHVKKLMDFSPSGTLLVNCQNQLWIEALSPYLETGELVRESGTGENSDHYIYKLSELNEEKW